MLRQAGDVTIHSATNPAAERHAYVFGDWAGFVAQTASLLFRRMPSCRTAPWPESVNSANALPIGNRRHSRLTICVTLNRYGHAASIVAGQVPSRGVSLSYGPAYRIAG